MTFRVFSPLARVLAGFFLSVVVACGGGGGETEKPFTGPPRTDLYFGYYDDCDDCVDLTKDHVNLVFVHGWGAGPDSAAKHALEAVAAGKKIVLAVDWRLGRDSIRYQFNKHRALNTLGSVVALYPQDEPTGAGHMTGPGIVAMVAMVRSVATEFVELTGVKVAAIYCGGCSWDGALEFDWIAIDDYPRWPMPPLAPGQRAMLVVGGFDPYRVNPKAAVDFAETHTEVVGIVSFLCRWPDGGPGGICSNGMLPAYRAAGKIAIGGS